MAVNKTQTQVLHDNKKAGETLTECAARLSLLDETLSEATKRLIDTDGVANPTPITISFHNVEAKKMTIKWSKQLELGVDSYLVSVSEDGTPIHGSPFKRSGTRRVKPLKGLTASTEYEVTVSAIDDDGDVIIEATDTHTTKE